MSSPYPPPDDYGLPPAQGMPGPGGAPFGPPFAPGQPPQGVSGLAIASLVAAFLFPPLAIIFGHLALSQIESRNEGGRGLAVTGLVLGYLFTVLTIVGVIIAVVFLVVVAREFDEYRVRSMDEPATVAPVVHVVTEASADIYQPSFAVRLSIGSVA